MNEDAPVDLPAAQHLAPEDVLVEMAEAGSRRAMSLSVTQVLILSIMAGGTVEAMQVAQPTFDVLGKSTVHIGDVGTGQITKAANQVIVGLNIGAVAEALALAKRAGADITRVRDPQR